MSYQITYHPGWIHVEYMDDVDAYDIITQANDPAFLNELEKVKTVFYDYSNVRRISFNEEDLKGFATMAKVKGSLIGPINAITMISPDGDIDDVKAYKHYAECPEWQVHIAATMAEAQALIKRFSTD